MSQHNVAYRSQKSQGQKKLREAVLGEELGAVKKKRTTKKKKDGGGVEGLPDVSRVDVEEVGRGLCKKGVGSVQGLVFP